MPNIFFISDSHHNHARFLTFTDAVTGELIRPEFSCVEEMDETLISRWNERVKPQDTVYHLGDLCFGGPAKIHAIMPRLNGRKKLVAGNHDLEDTQVYLKYFEWVRGSRRFGKDITGDPKLSFIASHIPIHPDSLPGKSGVHKFCVHGHLHKKKIADPQYLNVCVENTGYAPISLEEVLAELRCRI